MNGNFTSGQPQMVPAAGAAPVNVSQQGGIAARQPGSLVVQKKKPFAFIGKLSFRERLLIIVFATALILGAGIYFLILPQYEENSSLKDELSRQQRAEINMREQIQQKPAYDEQYNTAFQKYETNKTFFYTPMSPEQLDESVTNLLIANGLKPVSLSMGSLSSYTVTPYSPQSLTDNVVAELEEAAQRNAADNAAPNETPSEGLDAESSSSSSGIGSIPAADETLTENEDTLPNVTQGGSSESSSTPFNCYAYDVNVSATGTMKQLYNLLAAVNGNRAMDILRLSFSGSASSQSSSSSSTSTGNTSGTGSNSDDRSFSMQFRLYVFVESAALNSSDLGSALNAAATG